MQQVASAQSEFRARIELVPISSSLDESMEWGGWWYNEFQEKDLTSNPQSHQEPSISRRYFFSVVEWG